MANYTKTTDFAAKDTLPGGDTNKVVRGSEFETEFDAISTAIATKSDTASPTFTGTVTIPTADINGGNIDGTVIGASTAAAGTFSDLTATTADINAGTIDNAVIGGSTAVAGTFTNLTASGTVNFSGATISNLGTITTANLDGGTVDNAVIGGTTPAAGSFTTLSVSSTFTVNGGAVTATAAELNILDGVTASTAELNILDGKSFVDEDDMSSNSATAIPSQQSVKAYVDSQTGGGGATLSGLTDTNITSPADAALLFYDTATSKWIDNAVSGDITIADTGVAAIGTGVIVNADISASAAIDISKLNGVTATAAELNILDGVTATTAELNILDGVTATAAELNILDGVTSTTAELNILDGVTSTAAELNILDGVTSTAAELNLVDGSTADTVVNSKAVIYGAAGQITANELDVDNIQIDANAVKSTNTNGNIQLFPNGTGFTELYGNTNAGAIRFNCESNSHGVTVKGPPHSAAATYSLELPDADGSAGQLLKTDGSGKLAFTSSLPGVTSTSAELNLLDGSTANTVVNSKAVIYGSSGEITTTQLDLTGQGDLRLQDSSGGQYVALQAAATVGSSYTLTLPSADGSSGQVLQTNGSGTLSFADAGGGGLTSSSNVNLVEDATEVEFTGIPAGTTLIFMQMHKIRSDDDANDWGIQLGGSSGYKTSGYEGGTWDGPSDSTGSQSGKLGLFYYNSTGRIDAASAILWKGPGNYWMSIGNAVGTHHGVAWVNLGEELTKLKLMLQNGGRDFDVSSGGSCSIQYM